MKLRFLGATRTVTGSCHLLEVNGLRVALDFGLFQGRRDWARELNQSVHDGLGSLDAVILSHGHLDHCGRLPVLTRAGYTGPIHCTPATAAVARIVLEDSAQIQVEDAEYLNRRQRGPGQERVDPLYTPTDARQVFRQFRTADYGKRIDLGKGVSFTFHDAGHVLGSAYVLLEATDGGRTRRLLFTGDIGRCNTPIIGNPAPVPGPVDVVITESTYAGKTHAPMEQVGETLLECMKAVQSRRGRMIVPAFAVGRTQTVLWYYLKFVAEKRISPMPVFVDSPMGAEVTEAYSGFSSIFDEETRQLLARAKQLQAPISFTVSSQQSREINSTPGPCMIVASSPTLEFGRVLHHVKISLERPQDLIAFVGWTPPHTLGRRIIEGEQRVRVFGRFYDVKCERRTINGMSAHADGEELMKFLAPAMTKDTTVFVVHGEPDRAETMADLVRQSGAAAVVPAMETYAIA
jgi:metallo-beta-lactamase family protein